MKKGLTTHVLDLTNGTPAESLKVELWRLDETSGEKYLYSIAFTNKEGRIDDGLINKIEEGEYELVFCVGHYFQKKGTKLSAPVFYNEVPVRFSIGNGSEHYHIPLLISPYGYQTYRGC